MSEDTKDFRGEFFVKQHFSLNSEVLQANALTSGAIFYRCFFDKEYPSFFANTEHQIFEPYFTIDQVFGGEVEFPPLNAEGIVFQRCEFKNKVLENSEVRVAFKLCKFEQIDFINFSPPSFRPAISYTSCVFEGCNFRPIRMGAFALFQYGLNFEGDSVFRGCEFRDYAMRVRSKASHFFCSKAVAQAEYSAQQPPKNVDLEDCAIRRLSFDQYEKGVVFKFSNVVDLSSTDFELLIPRATGLTRAYSGKMYYTNNEGVKLESYSQSDKNLLTQEDASDVSSLREYFSHFDLWEELGFRAKDMDRARNISFAFWQNALGDFTLGYNSYLDMDGFRHSDKQERWTFYNAVYVSNCVFRGLDLRIENLTSESSLNDTSFEGCILDFIGEPFKLRDGVTFKNCYISGNLDLLHLSILRGTYFENCVFYSTTDLKHMYSDYTNFFRNCTRADASAKFTVSEGAARIEDLEKLFPLHTR